MDANPATDVTALLRAHGAGHPEALDRLVPLVYDDLRRMAHAQARRAGRPQTLDTTGLVHEAYLRLVDQTRATWRDRGHFFAVCAMAMRQIAVDAARRRGRQKRGGDAVRVPLEDARDPAGGHEALLLDLDRALDKLSTTDERLVRVVECRYFAGYTEQETADTLGLSLRTAQREWLKARAWLREELFHG